MSGWLVWIIFPTPFILLQLFMAYNQVTEIRQHKLASKIFVLLTWAAFVLGVWLIFHFLSERQVWFKIIVVLCSYAMGRCLYTAINSLAEELKGKHGRR